MPKVTIAAFASEAGVGVDRVRAHLKGWETAAEAGVVAAADSLSPGEEVDLDVEALPDWSEFYVPVTGGGNGGTKRKPTVANLQNQIDLLSPQERAEIAATTLASEEVVEAINENPLLAEPVVNAATEAIRRDSRKNTEAGKTRSKQIAASDALAHIQAAYDDIERANGHHAEAQYEIVRWNVAMDDDWFSRMGGLITRTRSATSRLLDHLDRTDELLTENKDRQEAEA